MIAQPKWFERRVLQIAVALGCLVPLIAGGAGVFWGVTMLDEAANVSAGFDSHVRYLSGLLFAIGLVFASTIPAIERQRNRFRLLAAIVVTGGLARLIGVIITEQCTPASAAALAMELLVTPGLALWQRRIARETNRNLLPA